MTLPLGELASMLIAILIGTIGVYFVTFGGMDSSLLLGIMMFMSCWMWQAFKRLKRLQADEKQQERVLRQLQWMLNQDRFPFAPLFTAC